MTIGYRQIKKAIPIAVFFLLLSMLFTFLLPNRGDAAVPVGGKWNRTLDGKSFAMPAAGNRLVYVGSNNGILYALESQTGRQKWKFKTDYRVPCLPLVGKDGMIYLCCDNGALYVLNALNGEQSWKNTDDIVSEYSPSPKLPYYHVYSVALGQDKVFQSTPDGNLHAYDTESGHILWTYSSRGGYITSPSVYKDLVFIGMEDGRLIALDVENGTENWSFKTGDAIHYPPEVKDNIVYIGSTDRKLYALDFNTGKSQWEYAAEESIESTPVVHKNLVFFCSSNGKLSAVDTIKHRLKWRFDSSGSVVTQPVIDEDTVYLGSNDGKLYALSNSTGQLLWAYDSEGILVNPVTVFNQLIFLVTNVSEQKEIKTSVTAFQKGTYPGTDVVVYGHEESPLITSLVDYHSASIKNEASKQKLTNLPDIISWPFGYQFNQIEQSLVDLTLSSTRYNVYKTLINNFKHLSSRFPSSAYMFSFILTPFSLVVTFAFIILSWSLFLTILVSLSAIGFVCLPITSNNRKQANVTLIKLGLRNTIPALKNYPLIIINTISIFLGCAFLLILFNYLFSTITVSIFYLSILIILIILLLSSSYIRSCNLALLQKEQLNLSSLPEVAKYSLFKAPKMIVMATLYLIVGILIGFLLETGVSYDVYYITFPIAVLLMVFVLLLLVFADVFIIYQNSTPLEAIEKSSYLVISNLRIVAKYICLTALVIGCGSLIINPLLNSTVGIAIGVLFITLLSSYLVHIHSNIFHELISQETD